MCADGSHGYEFVVEYDRYEPNVGIYFGVKGLIFDRVNQQTVLERINSEWQQAREAVKLMLSNVYPQGNFDSDLRYKLTDNANNYTYWPFWVTLQECEPVEVAAQAVTVIRKIYEQMINRSTYLKNKAVQANIEMARQLIIANDESESHCGVVLLRNIFGSALVLLPCYVYDMPLWLAIVLSIIVIIFAIINLSHIASEITKEANDKKKRICQYAITLSRRLAGDTPKLEQIGSIVARRNATLWGAIIGGIIGLFVGGVGIIPGAIVGAFIGSFIGGDERADRMTDGEDWDQIDLSITKMHLYSTLITFLALLAEIYVIFFTDIFD